MIWTHTRSLKEPLVINFGREYLTQTQTQLAEAIGSTQRAISHYETVAEFSRRSL